MLSLLLLLALQDAVPAEPAQVAPDSPRVSLTLYLDACRSGSFETAGDFLDVPAERAAEAPDLARRLKAVLDRHAWIDLETVSGEVVPGPVTVATIPGPGGSDVPVRMRKEGDRWVFTRAVVNNVDAWFGQLDDAWLIEALPAPLLLPGPGDLLWWQWLALPIVVVLAWIVGSMLSNFTRKLLAKLADRTKVTWDDVVIERLAGPLTLAWAVAAAFAAVPFLSLYGPAEEGLRKVLSVVLFFSFFWGLLRSVDVLGNVLARSQWAQERGAARSLVPLGSRVVKVIVVAMGIVGIVAELGYSVTGLLAGLSIGGLAVALAAQKTGENLFGAFSIGIDQPLRIGDFVKVDDFMGTVETIGLRSTRIRTMDRTLITLPNGQLAEKKIESYSVRDRLRLHVWIGVLYSTTHEQMKQVLAGVERVMREHPKIWPDAMVVRFGEFAESSLNIEIMCWFQTTVYNEFRQYREEVFLGFMKVVEDAGTEFAFPTRTVHMVKEG